ncbi:MAG TPA: hypothetical protein VF762_21560 [Blastocatellia bacterium]
MTDLKDLTPYAATLALTAIVLLKVLPTWKAVRLDDNQVRLAELDVRKKEADVRREEAASVGRLTEVFKHANEVSEELKILLRTVMSQHKTIEGRLSALEGNKKSA